MSDSKINSDFIDNLSDEDKNENQALKDILKSTDVQKEKLKVIVASPFSVYYDDLAFSISAVNETGPFDILPKHHNFICLLKPCEVAIRTITGQIQNISINGGLMHVKRDQVNVFLDI